MPLMPVTKQHRGMNLKAKSKLIQEISRLTCAHEDFGVL